MKKFEKPVIEIEKFECEDVLSESNGGGIEPGENETPTVPGRG